MQECRLQLTKTPVVEHCTSLSVGRHRAALYYSSGGLPMGTLNSKAATIQRASDGGRWFPEVAPARGPAPIIGRAAWTLEVWLQTDVSKPTVSNSAYGHLGQSLYSPRVREICSALTRLTPSPEWAWFLFSRTLRLQPRPCLNRVRARRGSLREAAIEMARVEQQSASTAKKGPDTQRVDAGPPFPGPASVDRWVRYTRP